MPGIPAWTFLTNHSHVLICLARDESIRLRDIAVAVGITERAVQRIVADLEEGNAISIVREGRRNRYVINPDLKLRHPLESDSNIRDLLSLARAGQAV